MLKPHEKHEQAIIKRKGAKQHDEGHNGAWKVAFADFCLALLSLFLVLWLMAAREQQHLKEVLLESRGSKNDEGQGPVEKGGPRGSLIERFPIPRESSGNTDARGKEFGSANGGGKGDPTEQQKKVRYESPSDLAALSRALATMSAEAGLSSNLEAVITPYGLRVMLHDTDHQGMFVRGSSTPTDRFQHLLRKMGPLFAQMENQMLVVGHTDSSPYADTDYLAYSNWTLSSNRAMAARANLLAGGMNPDSVLQVVGMADRAPMDTKNVLAGVNRRIELLILTSAQAANISAMYGSSVQALPLTDDADTALPSSKTAEDKELRQLREKLLPARGRSEHAN
ncbi:MAG TPA: flagellar motor protein MotB [Janthinobacterium sp.]|nr:flagellar motor protein MotB [Janthinobacterium sp.]